VEATLAELGGVADAPQNRCGRVLPVADVVVQYDETDLHFIRRVLSEAHLVGFFDPSADHAWTLCDNVTSAAAPLPTPLVFRPPSGLVPSSPHVLALSTEDALSVRETSLRDYNFEHPQLSRAVPAGLDGQAESSPALPHELGQHQGFEIGRFTTDQDASAIATRELQARRSPDHTVVCITNFALTAGSRFLLLDHPRTDLGTDFIVIASTVVVDDSSTEAGSVGGRRYEATCIPASQPHFATPVAKPRVPASESAFIVGDGPEGTVEVDAYGRVKIELPWDRRDLRRGNPTRWVRVSQAWAGSNLGIVTLPRIGDEVLVSYLGGDPDQAIVVGRAHNALTRTPLQLPDPDRTLSVWRSRTIGGDGYNEILMDDAPGGERLWLRAERHHKLHVKGSSDVLVDGDSHVTVGGDCEVKVKGALDVQSASFTQETGPHETRTTKTKHTARDELVLESSSILIEATSEVRLVCGGSEITLTPGGVTIKGGSVTVEGDEVKIAATGVTDIDGALITLN
jgi:type VI secretion system secreted protein VgrG